MSFPTLESKRATMSRRSVKKQILTFLGLWGMGLTLSAQNPVIQTKFTPDPAPYVYNDTVYLFTDHDEDSAKYFKMKDWLLYSSTDMVNWTYRGTPISAKTFAWAKQDDNAWASQAICRNGKWFWYVAAEDTTAHLHGIGVATADKPTGPWRDALGHPLVPGNWGYIDPSVFIDDDGQAYLFWGNNGCWYAPLQEDMIHLAGSIKEVPGLNDPKCFGPLVMKHDYQLNKKIPKTNYEEGPWVTKRNGIYYLVYAAGGVPEFMAYSTATNINGPWTYQGKIMDLSQNSFTIHGGNISYHGRQFMFYHNGLLPGGGGFQRSTAIEEFKWDGDKLPFIAQTKEGVIHPVRFLDPYKRVEAETMAFSNGVHTDNTAGEHHYVTDINQGDWIKVRSVDFGKRGAKQFIAAARTNAEGCAIELRADSLNGKTLAICHLKPTGAKAPFSIHSCNMEKVKGVHDLFLVFTKTDDWAAFDFDWWKMKE
jgi:arabinoxylan arabinofuranohydrolase